MHVPVLLKEVMEYLRPKAGDVMLDATLGAGGHAAEILKQIIPEGRLIAIDRDPEAVERARRSLGRFVSETVFVNDNFRNIEKILNRNDITALDGAVFDLGVSSFQLDDGIRGFSFLKEGPLDMRFDARGGLSAGNVVNKAGKHELADIIRTYGEERYANRLAEAIVKRRKKKRLETTDELRDLILKTIGKKYSGLRIHPACRTFQALRIYVNDELGAIEEAVHQAVLHLKPGARICVISFHSLEDRIIKNIFRKMTKTGKIVNITKKPINPGKEEILANPRSRSAKLRVAERII